MRELLARPLLGLCDHGLVEVAAHHPGRAVVTNQQHIVASDPQATSSPTYLYDRMDYPNADYDGAIEPNMTICVKNYIGEEYSREGVKLEQHRPVSEPGLALLSRFPFERDLTGEQDGTRYARVLLIS